MSWRLPRPEPATLRVERRPAALLHSAPTWLLMLLLPLVPGFTQWSGLTFEKMALLAGVHAALLFSIVLPPTSRIPDDHVLVRVVFGLAPFLNVTLTSLIGALAREPATSPFWGFHLLYAAVLAQAYVGFSGVLVLLLAGAPPLVSAVAGVTGGGLVAAAVVGVVAAALYAMLTRVIARTRAAETTVQAARNAALRADGERSRLRLVEDFMHELGGAIARAVLTAEMARSRLERGEAGTAEAVARLLDGLRHALHELRAAVWALDPDPLPWCAVEAHLRRIASDLATPHACTVVAEVPLDTAVDPDNRLRLLRGLTAGFAALDGDVQLALRATADGVGLFVEPAPTIMGYPSRALAGEDVIQ